MSHSPPESGVQCDVDGAVATVSLCRPESRNAQTPQTWEALADLGRRLPEAVRVVLLRAEGPSFSAGLDRRLFTAEGIPGGTSMVQLAGLADDELADTIAGYQEAFTWWRRPDLVSIAVVQGHAVGAGFQLALACDLRVVSQDASFSMREPSLGLVPDLGGTQPLVEAVGYSRALEMCATGRWVDAAEARELGLATIVVPRDDLDDAATDLAAAILSSPAGAVTATKALLRNAPERSYPEQLRAEREAQVARLRQLTGRGAGTTSGDGMFETPR